MRNRLSAQRVTNPAEEAEDIDRALHFALALDERLTLFAREQFSEFGFARFENLRGLAQDAAARDRRHRRPCGKRVLRRTNCRLHVLLGRERIFRDRFARVRGILRLINLARPRAD